MFNFENEPNKQEEMQPIVSDSGEDTTDTKDSEQETLIPSENADTALSSESSATKSRKFSAELLDYLEIFVFAIGFVILSPLCRVCVCVFNFFPESLFGSYVFLFWPPCTAFVISVP